MGLSFESWIALLVWVCAILLAWRTLLGRQAVVTAPLAFLAYQGLNVLGVAIESSRMPVFRSDWPILVSIAFLLFVIGGITANLLHGFDPASEVKSWRNRPLVSTGKDNATSWFFVAFMILISMGIGGVFMLSVGYNTLFSQIEVLIAGSQVDSSAVSAQRGAVLSEAYRAAGYTVQFIAIILPTLIVYLWVEGKFRRSAGLRLAATVALVADIYFVTIQGGRTYILALILLLILTASHFTSPLPQRFRVSRPVTIGLFVVFIVSFSLITALQGRTDDTRSTDGAGAVSTGISTIWDRVGGDYSRTQMIALDALESEIPADGSQWWSQLKIALPGAPDTDEPFDVRVYRIIYGNDNGNNPLDPWGSYYYNFGTTGLLVVPFLLGLLAQTITIRGLIRAPRDTATVVIMSALGYRFMFVIDPYSLLLTGPFTLWLLNKLVHRFSPQLDKDEQPTAEIVARKR